MFKCIAITTPHTLPERRKRSQGFHEHGATAAIAEYYLNIVAGLVTREAAPYNKTSPQQKHQTT